MAYQAFEGFGVEIWEHGEWKSTKYFGGIQEAIKYAEEYKGTSAKVKFVTVNKWGSIIDCID